MNAKSAICFTSLFGLLILLGNPRFVDGRSLKGGRVLPDEAFTAIVQEANKSIGSSLKKGEPRSTYITVRVNALVIALAADNRLIKQDADRSAADLRDAALNLIDGLELYHTDRTWVLRHTVLKTSDNRSIHAELTKRFAALEQLAELKPNTSATPVRYRLSSRFTHEDVTFFFGGCGGQSGHRIEAELLRLTQPGKAVVTDELAAIAFMGYKVALVGELLRDHEDLVDLFKVQVPDRRKQWVAMAMDLEQAAWELAEVARAKQVGKAKEAIQKVDNACIACHQKIGFRHSQ